LVTRAVKAEWAEEATTKAKALVAELWVSPEYPEQNKGASPTLRTEEVEKLVGFESVTSSLRHDLLQLLQPLSGGNYEDVSSHLYRHAICT
jgi:hypothetical protein